MRVLGLDKSISYIKELQEKHGINNFFFLDSTVNISKRYINDLCDKIIASGLDIRWSDSARANDLDKDTLEKMRAAGCIRLIYGMETASPGILKYIDKRIELGELEDILRWTDEAGIWVGLENIYGFPHEKREDLDMMLDFIKRNKKHINTVYCNAFYLADQSKLYLEPEKYGIGNIIEVDCRDHPRANILTELQFGYDEIGGLKWEDKLKQTIESWEYISCAIQGNKYFPRYEFEHFLFYLYSIYDDKKEIVRVFNKVNDLVNSSIENNFGFCV